MSTGKGGPREGDRTTANVFGGVFDILDFQCLFSAISSFKTGYFLRFWFIID
jgi:hypothetical protein